MIRRKRPKTDLQLLRPCVLGGAAASQESPAGDDRPCACPVSCSLLEDTVRDLAARVNETWTGISGAITARRNELDDVLDRLASVGASDGTDANRRPIRTLVVSPSEAARGALARRMADDPRFALAGEAAAPADVVPLAAAGLPDLVLVHLPELARESLEDLADLGEWAPGSVVVVVSGLDVARVADLVVTSGVPDDWPRRQPSRSGGRRGRGGPGDARDRRASGGAGPGRVDPPRSIIQEAMRQIGVPMRRQP